MSHTGQREGRIPPNGMEASQDIAVGILKGQSITLILGDEFYCCARENPGKYTITFCFTIMLSLDYDAARRFGSVWFPYQRALE